MEKPNIKDYTEYLGYYKDLSKWQEGELEILNTDLSLLNISYKHEKKLKKSCEIALEERDAKTLAAPEPKYVWLNMDTGKFSNTWDQKDQDAYNPLESRSEDSWKLLKYSCLTDEGFEFYNQMKLR